MQINLKNLSVQFAWTTWLEPEASVADMYSAINAFHNGFFEKKLVLTVEWKLDRKWVWIAKSLKPQF